MSVFDLCFLSEQTVTEVPDIWKMAVGNGKSFSSVHLQPCFWEHFPDKGNWKIKS